MINDLKDRIRISADPLFSASGQIDHLLADAELREIPLCDLIAFKNHPFYVLDDTAMDELVASILKNGVVVPGIARPVDDGRYEIIAGHRRKRACELAGLDRIPMYVSDFADEEATMMMTETNIQRDNILPSEKANAYRMEYEARKHPGTQRGGRSLTVMSQIYGESEKKIQRYIDLCKLEPEILKLVDEKKITLSRAGALAKMEPEDQLKALSSFTKTNEKKNRKVILGDKELNQFFAEDQDVSEIKDTILDLLNAYFRNEV